MGEIADLMIDGELCQYCGIYNGDSIGVICFGCQSESNVDAHGEQKPESQQKIRCPACGQKKKISGLWQHVKDIHPNFFVTKWDSWCEAKEFQFRGLNHNQHR